MTPQRTGSRKGSAMILIVAVLALLAVLATVYLVVSRTERISSLATDEAINFDFARTAVLAQIQERIYNDSLGGYTGELMYIPPPWMPGDPAGHGQHVYQTFEPFEFSMSKDLGRRAVFESQVVMGPDYRLYRALSTHVPDFVSHGPPPGNTIDWAPLTANFRPAVGNPAARWYDYPERPVLNQWFNFGASIDPAGNLAGTPDQPYLVKDILYGLENRTDMSFLNAGRFNPATGYHTLAYNAIPSSSPGAGDTSVATVLDANWHMLTFSSAAGTRYRFAFRMKDTNGMANLNTGFVSLLGGTIDPDGVAATSLALDNPEILDHDPSPALHYERKGMISTYEGHSPLEWQTRAFRMLDAGYDRFASPVLVPPVDAAPLAQFFDFSDELELRAFAGAGTGYRSRPDLAWPRTLSPVTYSHPNRNYYTTYSWERQFPRQFPSRFSLLTYPPTLFLAPPPCNYTLHFISGYGGGPPLAVHDPRYNRGELTFIELANLLVHLGYTDDEALSYAINADYQESGNPYTSIVRDGPNWFLVRSLDGAKVSSMQLFYTPECQIPYNKCPPPTSASPPCDVYVPYVAQPFLNELAIILQPPANQNDSPTALDFAVELLNPYTSAPLNIRGWRLRVGNDPWFVFGEKKARDFPAQVPAAADAEHPGMLTVNLSPDADGFRGLSSRILTVKNKTINPVGQPVYLERPYLDNHGQRQWVVLDHFVWPTPPPTLAPGSETVTLSFQRNNQTSVPTQTQPKVGAIDGWLAACPVHTLPMPEPSLDRPNNVSVDDPDLFGPYLPDRAIDTFNYQPGRANYPFINRNIGQLEYISRIAPRISAQGPVTIPDLLVDRTMLFTRGGRSYFPQEAKVRFDYLADPRALELLRCITTTPAYEGLGEHVTINRIPGRINVNTATPQVLYVMMRTITNDVAVARNFAAAIVAYRDRTRRSLIDDHAYRRNGPDYDFSNPVLYPGRGIRSIAELAIPLGIITGTLRIDESVSPPQIAPAEHQTLLTLHGTPFVRYQNPFDLSSPPVSFFIPPPNIPLADLPGGIPHTHPGALWPRFFSQLTVRSDTFVVYGYMEALRVHPNVPMDPNAKVHHDNAFNWYDFDENITSMEQVRTTVDDRSVTLADDKSLRNLRIARRRFMAIIDRSFSNAGRDSDTAEVPEIVAIKDLPAE
jgi:hypothetical protein